MRKFLIFVEGKADVSFIRDFIIFHIKGLKFEIEKRKKKVIANSVNGKNFIVKIIEGGGYTVVKDAKSLFESNIKKGYEILVIQDADNPQKQDGGVLNRMRYLNNVKKESGISFKTFLFPNDIDDGDLETLLLKIVNEKQFDKYFDCHNKYADCSKVIAPEYSKELIEDKNVVFNYFRTYYGMKNAKEENRVFNGEYWNFTSKELEPLKLFLDIIINHNS